MNLAEAFGTVWPILLSAGGGYITLLVYIRKQFEDRLKEKDGEIARLRDRLDKREEYVWKSLTAAEASTALAQSMAGAGQGGR